MGKRGKIILGTLIVLIIGIVAYSIFRPQEGFSNSDKETLVKCLTEKEIYLYGTINCPNCDVQKEMFGEYEKDVVYINCFAEEERCVKYAEQKIFPFWGMGEEVIVGPVPLEKLKELSGC